ncbi:hypothetical protein [Anaeromicropila herbilytica]|uniref:Uncharacterized protein n=1 Tax=Anaeromicropila herbilytica TaxID=2785025 RepID=A0A7R7EPH6_9FIRM|nr:hypothetical protein [Anaeromicropila herbilytica]BCN32386.1 hypothetical protein bsdtb5_36810 [Anaeromicropila herbilytica]
MNILDIKGTSSEIKFILDNNIIVLADGELQNNGFFAYKSSMKLQGTRGERVMSTQEREDFIKHVKDFLSDKDFTVNFFD